MGVKATLKSILGIVFGIPLLLLLVALLLMLLFLMPVGVVLETWDILHMQATAPAEITKIEMRHNGDEGRPVITYRYRVGGRRYESERLMPGLMANHGGWTGSHVVTRAYHVGQKTEIHYDPDRPEQSCLLYGWFCWSVGFSLAVWGQITLLATRNGRMAYVGKALGNASLIYGGGLILIGPTAILVNHLGAHLAIYFTIFLAALLASALIRRQGKPEAEVDPALASTAGDA